MSLRIVEDGYDYRVVIADDRWVLRVPRRDGVRAALEREIAVLPQLAAALPVPVPVFEMVSHEPPFVAYRLIDGEPLVDEDPDGVRAFLDALHGLDVDSLPIEPEDWVTSYVDQCAAFARAVLPLTPPASHDAAQALFAEAESLTGFRPAVVHGDLGPEHLRVRAGRLVGVIDWGDMRVGDPALDYAWLLNGPFPAWDVDAELRRRARFYHRLGPWFEAHYGVFVGSSAHLERGLAGIVERL